jgi:hypothetical protein
MESQRNNNSHLESVASLRSIWNNPRTVCYRIDTDMDNDATHNTSQQVSLGDSLACMQSLGPQQEPRLRLQSDCDETNPHRVSRSRHRVLLLRELDP